MNIIAVSNFNAPTLITKAGDQAAYRFHGADSQPAHFEAGLQVAIMLLEFFDLQGEKIRREGRENFNQSRYEAEFDAFFEKQFAQSLGNLIRRALTLTAIPDPLKDRITQVKHRRDFLAHNFFLERAVEFGSRASRDKLIAELEAAYALFEAADRELSDFMKPHRDRWGMTEEKLERGLKEMKSEHGLNYEKD